MIEQNNNNRLGSSQMEMYFSIFDALEIFNKYFKTANNRVVAHNIIGSTQRNDIAHKSSINQDQIIQLFKKTVRIHQTESYIGDKQLQFICRFLLNLQQLHLSYSKMMRQINFSNFKRLKKIDLSQSFICSIKLVQMPELLDIQINGNTKLVYLQIKKCYKIKKFQIKSEFIKIIHLEQLPNLRGLTIYTCSFLTEFVIQKCDFLENLEISNNKWINDQRLQQICIGHAKLKNLSLCKCQSLKQVELIWLKSLKSLKMKSYSIISVLLHQLLQLQELDLSNCWMLQKININKCNNIKRLFLQDTYLNNEQIQNINLNQLKQLKMLYLGGQKLLNTVNLNSLQNLKILGLIKSRTKCLMLHNLQNLQILTISKCKDLTEFKQSNCSKLSTLEFPKSNLNNKDLQEACDNLKSLKKVDLQKSRIHEFKLQNRSLIEQLSFYKSSLIYLHLRNLKGLQEVNLYECKNLAKLQIIECQNIEKLDLSYTAVTNQFGIIDAIINSLANIRQIRLDHCLKIKQLNLLNCKQLQQLHFTFSYLQNLSLASLPKLKIIRLACNNRQKKIAIKDCPLVQNILMKHAKQALILQNFCFNIFKNLQQLNLASNNIESIEAIIHLDLTHANIINLQCNRIVCIKSLKKMTEFEGFLYISKNLILSDQNLCRVKIKQGNRVYAQSEKIKFMDLSIFKLKQKNIFISNHQKLTMSQQIQKMFTKGFQKTISKYY